MVNEDEKDSTRVVTGEDLKRHMRECSKGVFDTLVTDSYKIPGCSISEDLVNEMRESMRKSSKNRVLEFTVPEDSTSAPSTIKESPMTAELLKEMRESITVTSRQGRYTELTGLIASHMERILKEGKPGSDILKKAMEMPKLDLKVNPHNEAYSRYMDDLMFGNRICAVSHRGVMLGNVFGVDYSNGTDHSVETIWKDEPQDDECNVGWTIKEMKEEGLHKFSPLQISSIRQQEEKHGRAKNRKLNRKTKQRR